MRIGRIMIDTDNMTADEITTLINELRVINARKRKKETFVTAMTTLLEDAKAEGFTFLDKDFGQVIEPKDIIIFDEKA